MEKQFKVICLVVLVLLVIILPVAAIPSVIKSGTSTYVTGGNMLQPKTTWTTSDTGSDGNIDAWIQISPGTSMADGSRPQFTYRVFTPDGKDWFKDINPTLWNVNVDGQMAYVDQPVDFSDVNFGSGNNLEYGQARMTVYRFQPEHNAGKPSYQFNGPWKVDMIITTPIPNSGGERAYTKVATLTFNLNDGGGTTLLPTTTTPTPVPSNQKIIIDGEKYVDANVQKTGAQWDSSEEKCPTWRGSDWSGTGDYYLSHGGDTLTYLINAPATGTYVMWMRDWSDTNHAAGDRQVTVTIDGATIGTFDAASSFNKGTTGYGWDKFTTVNLGAGSHTLKITKKDTTSSAAIIDDLWFSSNVNEIPASYTTHSVALCSGTTPITPTPNQKIIVEGEDYVDANVQKTGAQWDSSEEKCPTWRGSDWSGTGDYYLSHGGDTLTYTINAPSAGTYVMWMRDWSDTNHAAGDRQVTVTIDGATIGTFDAANAFNRGTTGYGWDKLSTVNLGAGSHTMKITKKDTTSSAAIIDELWFSSNVNEIPASYTTHSEALCTVTRPIIYCTAPPCPSGKLACLLKDGCPGGCGYSCETPVTSVPPTTSGIETAVILLALGIAVAVIAKRKD